MMLIFRHAVSVSTTFLPMSGKKKESLVNYYKQVFILGTVLFAFFFVRCQKQSHSLPSTHESKSSKQNRVFKYVSTKSGLILRHKPNTRSKKLALLPYANKVEVLQEKGKEITISGATGKWTQVRFRKQKGWAFGGFLVNVVLDTTTMQMIEYLEEGAKEISKEPIRKQYLQTLDLYKKGLQLSSQSQKQGGQQLQRAYQQAQEVSRVFTDDEDAAYGEQAFYTIGELEFVTCQSYVSHTNCPAATQEAKVFTSLEEAKQFLRESIEKKDIQALVSAVGCMIETTCYACDAGSNQILSAKAFAYLFKNDMFAGEKSIGETYDTNTSLWQYGQVAILIQAFDREGKKWIITQFPELDIPNVQACSSPGV
ncbi:MAG: SH3 domain-containing protein [Spirochaetota bacterium]